MKEYRKYKSIMKLQGVARFEKWLMQLKYGVR